jgi:polyisoprenoid-binding protein YceI
VRLSPTTFGRILGLTAALAAAAMPAIVRAADLTADPAHTSATFSVKHLTLTTISGTIAVKEASVSTAPDGSLTSAKATLDLATIDTKFGDRDNDLRSNHWFDVAASPTMTFASTKITGDKNAMTILGNLTFHGKTNPVTLSAKYDGSVKDQRGRTHVGYTATGTIDRTKWDLGANFPPAIVGDDITIAIEMEAVQP